MKRRFKNFRCDICSVEEGALWLIRDWTDEKKWMCARCKKGMKMIKLNQKQIAIKVAMTELFTDNERESIMVQWDSWRRRVANGDSSSGPRDWFESVLDFAEEKYDEHIERMFDEMV